MVFKKPYAFFIKYFRLINLFLVLGSIYFIYNMNVLHQLLKNVYLGKFTNYSLFETSYLGFKMYLLLFLISSLIIVLLITLVRKKKPHIDYLYNIIYNIISFIYLLSVSNLFSTLNEEVVEITKLKLYDDISFLIMIPYFYFVIKYIMIVVGFNLKKFNFAKDILELKQDEKDNEEVEIVFDKDTYKVKRKIRRYFRELKYYFLENRMIISIIGIVVFIIVASGLFTINLFNTNNVKINKPFKVNNMSFKINNVYETEYDYKNNRIKDGYKFVVVSAFITNNYFKEQKVDLNRLRLFYGKEYVYANNFYNQYFNDLGVAYNKEFLLSGKSYNYLFVFRVPKSYKSSKYTFKFYDGVSQEKDESVGKYKVLKCKATKLKGDIKILNQSLKENVLLDKKSYGNSNITIKNFSLKNSYIYNDGNKDIVVYDENINNNLMILEYKLNIDETSLLFGMLKDDKEFFSKYGSVNFSLNGKNKTYNNLNVLKVYDDKVIISVPTNIYDAKDISFSLNFRNNIIVYKLK